MKEVRDPSHRRPPPERSLAMKGGSLVKEWDREGNAPLTPADVYVSSDKPAHWIGRDCGHRWSATINSRTNGGNGCPFCANQRILLGFNDLASQRPHLAADWHPSNNGDLTPRDVTATSGRRVWWKCSTCSWDWQTTIASRAGKAGTRSGHGCPSCAGQRCKTGITDLATRHPELVSEWDQARNGERTPRNTAASAGIVVWWKCATGHSWRTRVISRTGKKNGCPTCSGRVPERGINDLTTTHPDLVQEWHPTTNGDLRPEDVSAGSDKIVHWMCRTCSHEWSMPVKKRALNGTGCGPCTPWGTSKIEQAFSHAVAQRGYTVAEDRRLPIPMSRWHPRMECDIVLPQERVVIEYDGYPYHSREGSPERDERKTRLLLSNGWSVIRVRNKLEPLPFTHPRLRQIGFEGNPKHLGDLTTQVSAAIRSLSPDQRP